MNDEKPAEKPTVKMNPPPDWAIALSTKVVDGFNEVRADLETVKAEGQRTNLRLTRQEVRMDDVETRLANNSMRAKQSSSVDLDHEAKIADVIVETNALKKAIHDTNALAVSAVDTLKAQSDFMGMGKQGLAWLRSKEARADIVRAVTLIAAGYAALKQMGVIK